MKFNTKNKKIIFTDFDETIANKFQEVSNETFINFAKHKKNGNITSIVTGRPHQLITEIIKNDIRYYEAFNYIVTDNGSNIFEFNIDDENNVHLDIIDSHFLSKKTLKEIYNYAEANNLPMIINTFDGIYKYGKLNSNLERISKNIEFKDKKPLKQVFQVNLGENNTSTEIAGDFHQKWHDDFMTFSLPDGKARAVTQLMDLYPDYKSYAFGDHKNDIPMFKVVDVSFAVANAKQELVDICTCQLNDAFDDNAVSKMLNKLI